MQPVRDIIGDRIVKKESFKIFLLSIIAGLLIVGVYLQWQRNNILIRQHNRETFFRALMCDDLPISNDSNVMECKRGITRFMLPETGLFYD